MAERVQVGLVAELSMFHASPAPTLTPDTEATCDATVYPESIVKVIAGSLFPIPTRTRSFEWGGVIDDAVSVVPEEAVEFEVAVSNAGVPVVLLKAAKTKAAKVPLALTVAV